MTKSWKQHQPLSGTHCNEKCNFNTKFYSQSLSLMNHSIQDIPFSWITQSVETLNILGHCNPDSASVSLTRASNF